MPNINRHCKRTLKKYGVEGRDIHKWLDEPSRKYAGRHREFRHDTETTRLVGEVFGGKYGRRLAENIALDHIMADHEEEIKKRPMITVQFQKGEKPSIPCPYCGTLLKPSDQFCPSCGASRKKIIEEFDRAYELEKLKLQQKRKQLRKELKHEMELSKYTVQEKLQLQYLTRRLGEQDPVLDRMIQTDFEKHPEIKERIERKGRIMRWIVYTVLALWLMPSIVLGIVNFESGLTWFIGWIGIFILIGIILFFDAFGV